MVKRKRKRTYVYRASCTKKGFLGLPTRTSLSPRKSKSEAKKDIPKLKKSNPKGRCFVEKIDAREFKPSGW